MRFLLRTPSAIALLTLAAGLGYAQSSATIRDQHVEGVLLSESSHIQPGQPFQVGLLLRHDEGWHTYWKTSATGYATSIEWELPPGFEAGPIQWPAPEVYVFAEYTEYVYEGETLLPVTITPPAELPEGEIEIGFSVDWLMCRQACVPGGFRSTLRLPVRREPIMPVDAWKPRFEKARLGLPAPAEALKLNAWRDGPSIVLEIKGRDLPESAFFYDEKGIVRPESGAGHFSEADKALRFKLTLSGQDNPSPEQLAGVVRATGGWTPLNGRPAIAVDIPVAEAPPPVSSETAGSLAGILMLAFIGGMILNLMPCVFPVLGIKIMGFVNQAGESRGTVVAHGLVFTTGVLVSFWVLAVLLLILRSGGNQLGWGFQLQSPGFVLALTLLLFAFALNLSGLFEVGQGVVGIGANLTGKSGLGGSFFSGVLATVVATPCAAPLLAPALGAALALPPLTSLTVFTFIALGLSAPYLLLSSFPALVKWLPRPGAWMETFKQFMGFLLYATVAYLLWVLAGQLTDKGGFDSFSLLKVLLSLVLLALALWIYGRWAAFHLPRATRTTATLAAVIVAGLALVLGFSGTGKPAEEAHTLLWEEWGPGKAGKLGRQGRTVYVDFTARWCVTCQTNKAAVFSSNQVRQAIADREVVLLKADWTHRDPRISEELARFGRSAVPFNLVYGPGLEEPVILPEILTPGTVLEALAAASGD